MEVRDDGLVLKMIEAAVFAGAYSALARQIPEAGRGLGKMRVRWSGRVAALADEICDRREFRPGGALSW